MTFPDIEMPHSNPNLKKFASNIVTPLFQKLSKNYSSDSLKVLDCLLISQLNQDDKDFLTRLSLLTEVINIRVFLAKPIQSAPLTGKPPELTEDKLSIFLRELILEKKEFYVQNLNSHTHRSSDRIEINESKEPATKWSIHTFFNICRGATMDRAELNISENFYEKMKNNVDWYHFEGLLNVLKVNNLPFTSSLSVAMLSITKLSPCLFRPSPIGLNPIIYENSYQSYCQNIIQIYNLVESSNYSNRALIWKKVLGHPTNPLDYAKVIKKRCDLFNIGGRFIEKMADYRSYFFSVRIDILIEYLQEQEILITPWMTSIILKVEEEYLNREETYNETRELVYQGKLTGFVLTCDGAESTMHRLIREVLPQCYKAKLSEPVIQKIFEESTLTAALTIAKLFQEKIHVTEALAEFVLEFWANEKRAQPQKVGHALSILDTYFSSDVMLYQHVLNQAAEYNNFDTDFIIETAQTYGGFKSTFL